MVKVEVIENFTLAKFNELKQLKRATLNNQEGYLYVGDIFECNEEMVEYLTGQNRLNRAFVKVIEVIPEKKEIEVEKVTEKKPTTRKRKTSTKTIAKK